MWRVAGTAAEVRDVLADGPSLTRWWPAVYLSVHTLNEGDHDGVGSETALLTKGWLPYTLRWRLRIVEPITDAGYALTATGDLDGAGRWTFAQDGPEVVVTYDWRVSASKPLLRRLTWLCGRCSRPTTGGRWRAARRACAWNCVVAERPPRRNAARCRRHRRRPSSGWFAGRALERHRRRCRTVESGRCQCRNFRPTTPPTIATRHSSRAAVAGSPSATIP